MYKSISLSTTAGRALLLAAALFLQSCGGSVKTDKWVSSDTITAPPDTVRPMIEKPTPDATIIDSLTHDFSGVWIGDSVLVPRAVSLEEGFITFCANGRIRYEIFKNGPVITFSGKQVWIDRQHAHIDMFLESIEHADVHIVDAAMPVKGKLFATADLVSDKRMNVLWYPRDFVAAIREKGSLKSPEAFPSMFFFTIREPRCQ